MGVHPGFLVGKVKGFAPTPLGTPSIHNYYVDAPVTVTDIWVDSDNTLTNANKRADQWHTVAIGGAGRGGKGFFALDITNPASLNYPAVLWEMTRADFTDLGETWSVPAVGKILMTHQVSGKDVFYDKWVALVGREKLRCRGGRRRRSPSTSAAGRGPVANLTVNHDVGLAPDSGFLTLYDGTNNPVRSATGSYTSRSGNTFDNVTLTATGQNKKIYTVGTSYVSWSATGKEGRAILVLDAFTGSIPKILTHANMRQVAGFRRFSPMYRGTSSAGTSGTCRGTCGG